MLTASVDTQDNRLEYEVCGWGEEEESWGIVKGVILGVPDQKKTWNDLDLILDKVYKFADGKGLKVLRTFIDSGGHYTSNVYEYCKCNIHKQRFAIKGKGGPGIPLNYKIARASGYNTMPLVLLGVDDGKQQVMNRLSIDKPGPQYCHFPLNEDAGYDELYFKGIIAEQKKRVKRDGQLRDIWVNVDGVRNEPLDLRNYNIAAMKSLKPQWDKLKALLKGAPIQNTVVSRQIKQAKRTNRASISSADIW